MEFYFPLILDGATGTELQKRGFRGDDCPEHWTLEHPAAMQDLQTGYVRAGSDIIYAPTFGANRIKLQENHITESVRDYNLRLVEIARKSCGEHTLVAADITSFGKFLVPYGDMHFEEMYEIYKEQASALEEAGVDLFVVETMMNVPEVRAAVLAIKAVSDKPVLVSFTANEQNRTLSGSDIRAALEIFQSMGVSAFGLNCSVGPETMVNQIKVLAPITQIPLMWKPNAGMPKVVHGRTIYDCTPEEYTVHMQELAENYVGFFGACCGSTDKHIAAIAETAKTITVKKPPVRKDGKLYLCTEKELFILDPSVPIGKPLACNASLADAIEECEDAVISVVIRSAEELVHFENAQFMITKPLCLQCEDAVLLEQALRLYQGKCMYDGSLPEEVLAPLSAKYGMIY